MPEGCQKCGSPDALRIVYADRRAVRLCELCRSEAEEDLTARIADETRPHVGYAAGMPFVFLYLACGWEFLLFCVELYLENNRANVLMIHGDDQWLILLFLGVLGGVLGWPIGVFLRRSGLAGRAHWLAGAIAVVAACIVGEWLFVNAMIFRRSGVIDPIAATRWLPTVVFSYNRTWMLGKIATAGAILLGCGVATSIRPAVSAKL